MAKARQASVSVSSPKNAPESTRLRAASGRFAHRNPHFKSPQKTRCYDGARMRTREKLQPVVTYPRDAVLGPTHVAAALHTTIGAVEKLDLPCFYIGKKQRYIWSQVLDTLAQRANPDARPRRMA